MKAGRAVLRVGELPDPANQCDENGSDDRELDGRRTGRIGDDTRCPRLAIPSEHGRSDCRSSA